MLQYTRGSIFLINKFKTKRKNRQKYRENRNTIRALYVLDLGLKKMIRMLKDTLKYGTIERATS